MKNIKMIIILMVAVFLLGIGSGIGLNRVVTNNNINKINKQPITIVRTLTQSTDDVKLNKGDVYKQYSNDSWSIENESTNTFEFQPMETGDWNFELNNKKDFDKLVQTYLSIQNNGFY
ncbi:hypothetical protein [Clostridium sardiniense]|uniref:hypothetical protein n=1 Tax=Clostridium sardiniense TaxID=29369 RepID=UPI00195A5F9C|nr:hypothetical protein [Clostridium sardiniense]MBM7836303.1 hypothetical protein [Clostridium sardiniense]